MLVSIYSGKRLVSSLIPNSSDKKKCKKWLTHTDTEIACITCIKLVLLREGFLKKWKFLMAFAIKRRTPSPPLMALISIHFFLFFLLQLNLTYMKRILHLVSDKNITLKSSYNWFKINIHQQLRKVWKYFLAFNVQSIIRKDGWIQNLFKDTEIQWKKAKCHLIALLPINMHSEKCANLRF